MGNYVMISISYCLRFWAMTVYEAMSLSETMSESVSKVLGRTKYVQYRRNKFKTVHWMNIEAFII